MDSALDLLELDELVVLANLDMEANNLSGALIKLKLAHAKGGKGDLLAVLARLYARLGLFERAKPLFVEYIKENPKALIEKFQYGMTLFDSNDLDRAYEVYESILEEEPTHPPATFYSALVLSRRDQTDDAIIKLKTILENVDKENLFYNRANELLDEIQSAKS